MTAPNMITPHQLARLIGTPGCPVLIDVCIDEDFADDPRVVPTSRRHPFARIADLVPSLTGQRVVVMCQKGKKLSQGAAALLRSHGVQTEALEGGIVAWREAGLPLLPFAALPERGGLWVTRHRPKVDRIACPWLIRLFIDPEARFLFVEPSAVLDVAEKFRALSFDTEGAVFAHGEDRCSFDAVLAHFDLHTEALSRLATVVRCADGVPGATSPEGAGLLALSLGLSRMHTDDVQQLEAGMGLYDALYRWCRDAQGETHDARNHGGRA